MNIKSLEKMESIVASNKSLLWDGWTVINRWPSESAKTSKDGVFSNGKWYLQKIFPVTKNGWDIPDKFVRNND
jgi:hypothetical protein